MPLTRPHTAVTASDTVTVSRATPSLTLNNNGKFYAYGADVAFTARLGTTYTNRSVEIRSDPFGADKPKKLVKTGKIGKTGNTTYQYFHKNTDVICTTTMSSGSAQSQALCRRAATS